MTMRSMFWCCTSITLATAASFHLAAEHVSAQPNSTLGRYTAGAYRLGVQYNPFSLLGQTMERVTYRAAHLAVTAMNVGCRSSHSAPSASAAPSKEEVPEGSVRLGAQSDPTRAELEALHVMRFQEPSEIQWGSAEEAADVSTEISQIFRATKEPDPVVAVREPAKFMSRCADGGRDEPAMMPFADESPIHEQKTPMEFWKILFRQTADDQAADQTDAARDVAPLEESEAIDRGDPPGCQEDPTNSQQYPGCPYIGPRPSQPRRPNLQKKKVEDYPRYSPF